MGGAIVIGGDYQGLGIIRSLGRHGIPVYLLDSAPSIAMSSKFTNKVVRCPVEDEKMVEFLFTVAQKEKLYNWVIYPTTDDMVRCLSMHRDILGQYYKIPPPNWEITRLLYNKRLTYELADRLNIPFPKTFYPEDNISQLRGLRFPVIIKPATRGLFYSKVKKKALLARNEKELFTNYKFARTMLNSSEIMIQEVVPIEVQPQGINNLYSFCSLFKDGVAVAKISARRIRQHPMDFGRASTFVQIVNIPELEKLGVRLLSSINYYGLSEIEFMWDTNDKCYKLLEVNARTWGWHTLGNQIGVDFPFLLYKDMIGETVHQEATHQNTGKWVRVLTDTPVALKEIMCGRLKLNEYLVGLKGKKEYAVWSPADPLPFLLEILLLPYLLKARGY